MVLGTYFPPVNALPKQKCAMRRGIRNPIKLKVRRYAARLIYINDYLAAFPGAKESEKIGETDLNEILLNSMPNTLSRKSYVHDFDCESFTFNFLVTCLN